MTSTRCRTSAHFSGSISDRSRTLITFFLSRKEVMTEIPRSWVPQTGCRLLRPHCILNMGRKAIRLRANQMCILHENRRLRSDERLKKRYLVAWPDRIAALCVISIELTLRLKLASNLIVSLSLNYVCRILQESNSDCGSF